MDDFAKGLVADVKKVTKKWAEQRRREIRDARAQSRRRDVFMRPRRITVQDAAWEIMPTAYLKASEERHAAGAAAADHVRRARLHPGEDRPRARRPRTSSRPSCPTT